MWLVTCWSTGTLKSAAMWLIAKSTNQGKKMTTKVTVDARAGWPVRVTKVMYEPGRETGREDVIVPANTVQDFYIHSTMLIHVEEMTRDS